MADEHPIHETTTEARAGDGSRVNRTILFISLALVVTIFAVIVVIGAR